MLVAGQKILVALLTRKRLGLITIRRGQHVADVFGRVFPRHRFGDDAAKEIVRPVFPMMFVAAGMGLANGGEIAIAQPLFIDGGMVADIITDRGPKLFGGIFA